MKYIITEYLLDELNSTMAKKEWSRYKLAKELGVTDGTVSRWYGSQGSKSVKAATARRIMAFLNISRWPVGDEKKRTPLENKTIKLTPAEALDQAVSEICFVSFIDSMQDLNIAVAILDDNCRITHVNDAYVAMFNCCLHESCPRKEKSDLIGEVASMLHDGSISEFPLKNILIRGRRVDVFLQTIEGVDCLTGEHCDSQSKTITC